MKCAERGNTGALLPGTFSRFLAVLGLLFCAGAWVHNRKVQNVQSATRIQAEDLLEEIAQNEERLAEIEKSERPAARPERMVASAEPAEPIAQPRPAAAQPRPAAATDKPAQRARRENKPPAEEREIAEVSEPAPTPAQRAAVLASGGSNARAGARSMIKGISSRHERRLEGALDDMN